MRSIRVNQIGYRELDKKRAVFADLSASEFSVVNSEDGSVVYKGKLSDEIKNTEAQEFNRIADFSEVTKAGKYYITDGNGNDSYEFVIGDRVYEDALKASLKMFYLQRCGSELPKEYAGIYAHPSCHDTKARVYGTEEFLDVNGGWHDAGDYGRYIVAAAKAVTDLLMTYELCDSVKNLKFDIPENSYKLPDILAEAKYELDWMLKMQNEEGGVYHKVTCAAFPEFVMPEEEKEELIICPVSDTATADFVATMCYAYRVYSAFESTKDFAAKCMAAAEKSMKYLETNKTGPFTNPEGIVTGEYGDVDTKDEIFWAYAEMYKTTGESKYEKKLSEMYSDEIQGLFEWKEVGFYGFYAYITSDYSDKDLYEKLKARLTDYAEGIVKSVENDPYGYTMNWVFYWGCMMGVANDAMLLILLDRLNNENKYKDQIPVITSHIFGNNANDVCYLTGFGTNSPQNPHHRPSAANKKAMPGMLVGGPEPLLLDDYMKANYKDVPRAKRYADNTDSYSTNEITIYWNSPLVFILASQL